MNTKAKEKLLRFRKLIEDSNTLDEEFGKIVGIELFDLIKEQLQLREELERRFYYLNDLAKDKNFMKIQEALLKIVLDGLKCFDVPYLKEVQVKWKNSRFNPFWDRQKNSKEWLELPELHTELLKKENYFMLGDDGIPFVYGDIVYTMKTMAIRNQYQAFEQFLEYISSIDRNKLTHKPLDAILERYNNLFYEFNEKIYAIPVKIHLQSFITFYIFSVSVHPRKSYEQMYAMHNSSIYKGMFFKFKDIKKACLHVIDDLCDICDEHERKITLSINRKEMSITITKTSTEIYSCEFRKPGGKNKRFEYILKIAQNPKIGGIKLNSNLQTLSKEILDINTRMKNDLALINNVITNNRNSGYKIDDKYYIVEIV